MNATTNPYPGLRPFRQDESRYYVGRESQVRRLNQGIRVAPITVLFARSGTGKSSFLACRLLPQFQEAGQVAYLNEWGSAPAHQLVLHRLEALEATNAASPVLPLLVLDQFEDIFKARDNLRPLWQLLADVANGEPARARILISMREEWLGAWWEIGDEIGGATDSMIRLEPLQQAELVEAVHRPARLEGKVDVEAGLPERIIADLRQTNLYGEGEFVEAGLVQSVCQRLWDDSVERAARGGHASIMTVARYGELGGAQRILQEHVWRDLARRKGKGGVFTPLDRALWCGLARHLIVARGVKSLASPHELAGRLRSTDMGLAGKAVLAKRMDAEMRRYLDLQPEHRRGKAPAKLTQWIGNVLEQAQTCGLVKKQTLPPPGERRQAEDARFELVHDALADLLLQFRAAFEATVERARRRWLVLGWMLLSAYFFCVPIASVATGFTANQPMSEKLILIAASLLGMVMSYLLFWRLGMWIRQVIVRSYTTGTVPLPADVASKPSWRRLLLAAKRTNIISPKGSTSPE